MEVYNENNGVVTDTEVVLNNWRCDFEALLNLASSTNSDIRNLIKFQNNNQESIMVDPIFQENHILNRNFTE